MRYEALSNVEHMGEESGREECACDFPFLPEKSDALYRDLTRYGRGRAQGLYQLRGKAAKVFAQCWATGYIANRDMFERDGYFEEQYI